MAELLEDTDPETLRKAMLLDERFSAPTPSQDVEAKYYLKFEPPDFTDDTDRGRAIWFLYNFGNQILYNHGHWKKPSSRGYFHIWNNIYWEPDDSNKINDLVNQGIKSLHLECALGNNNKSNQSILNYIKKLSSYKTAQYMLEWVKTNQDIAVHVEDMDTNPYLIGLKNGVYDLEHMTFLSPTGKDKPRQSDRISRVANVVFDEEAGCPRWMEFLNLIFEGDQEMIAFIHRALGYTFYGKSGEKIFFILLGKTGQNGKSTFIKTLQMVFGDYSRTMAFKTLLKNQKEDPNSARSDIVRLSGARFVSAIEPDAGKKLSDGIVKLLTGGSDVITARTFYKEEIEFDVSFTIWLACNNHPDITGHDPAIWNRVKQIEFNHQITKPIKDYETVLIPEAAGIFNWCIEGWRDYRERISRGKDGLGCPPKVIRSTEEYHQEMDYMGAFIKECCWTVDKTAREGAKELHQRFVEWGDGEYEVSNTLFGRFMKALGYVTYSDGKKRYYKGIRIKTM